MIAAIMLGALLSVDAGWNDPDGLRLLSKGYNKEMEDGESLPSL